MSFPFINTEISTLGGHTSTFFKVSADTQDDWINNIFHNSRYGIFCLADGKLELISKGLNTTKFRKCKCNDEQTALDKIAQWMSKFWSLTNTNSTTHSDHDHHSVRNAV